MAQVTIFNNLGDGQSWNDANNWNNGTPYSLGNTAQVQIGTFPTAGGIVLSPNDDTIASLTFNSTLGGSIQLVSAGTQVLTITGAITNNSGLLQQVEFASIVAAGSSTWNVGTGGLTVSNLTVGTSKIAVTGSGGLQIVGSTPLNFTINSNSNFGSIGPIQASGVTFNINTTTNYQGATGDFFQLATGTLSNITASTSGVALSSGLSWISTLINKGILFVEPTAGTTVINSGVVLPIDKDSEFNVAGTAIIFNGTTSAAELLTDNAEDGTNTPFSTSRNITINASSNSVIAALTGTTATYSGVISDAGGTAGTLTIGDATNHGTVVLATNNSIYTGGTTVAAGTLLQIGNTAGSATGTGAVTLAAGDTVQGISTGAKIGGQLNLAGTNTVTTTAGSLTLGNLSVTNAGNQISSGSTVAVVGATTINGTASFADNGALTSVVTVGTGTLTGTGSVAGAVGVTGGTINGTGLTLSGLTTFNTTGTLSGTDTAIGGISLLASTVVTESGAQTGAVNLIQGSTGTTTLNGTGNSSIGAVTLNGKSALSSTGTLTTGGITVNGANNAINSGTVTGATSLVSGAALADNGTLTGAVTVGTGTLTGSGTVGSTTGVAGGTINGTGLTLTGLATFTGAGNVLSGTETLTNGLNVVASGTLTESGTQTGAAVNLVQGTGTATPTTLTGSGTVGAVTLNGNSKLTGNTTLTTTGVTVNGTSNTLTGTVVGNTTITSGAALADSGTITGAVTINSGTLTGTGSVSSTTTVNGGTINGTGLTLTGLTTFNNTGTLSGTDTATGGISLLANTVVTESGTQTGVVNLVQGTTGTTTLNGTGTSSIGAVTLNGNGALSSTGTLTTGGITVNNAGNVITSGTVAGATSLVGSAALADNGTLTGAVTVGSGTLTGSGTVGSTTSVTGGTINGTGLTLSGLTTFNTTGTLSGTDTATGGISLLASTVVTESGAQTGAVNLIQGSTGTTTLNGTGNSSIGAVTLNGKSALSSTGTLTTGGITVNGANNAINSGTVTGATSLVSGAALADNGTLTGAVTVGTGTLTGSGTVGSTTGVAGGTINGTGLTLTGLATFTGAGNVLSGTETLTNGLNVVASGTLTESGTQTGAAVNLVQGTGTATPTTLTGSGTVGAVTLNGNSKLTGNTTLTTTGVTVNGTSNTLTGTVVGNTTITSGAALADSGTITGAVTINSGTLTGTGSVSSTTTVNGGTINGTGLTLTGLTTFNNTGTLSGTDTATGGISLLANTVVTESGTQTGVVNLVQGTTGTTTLNGTGSSSIGAVTLNGNGALSSTGTLTTGGITVASNSIGNTISSGTVNGAITQLAGSVLAVNGTGGSDALAAGSTLSGTGTVAAVTLAGTDTLTSSGTLHTGGITVTGAGNVFSAGTVTGNTSLNAGASLAVNNTLTGTLSVGTGTLSGTGTISGPTTVTTGTINMAANAAIGTLSVGGLTIGGSTLDFKIGGTTTATDKITAGSLTIGSGTTSINISDLLGTTTLTAGNYTLLSYTNASLPTNLSNLTLNTTTLNGDTLSLVTSTLGVVTLNVSNTTTTQTFTGTTPSAINIISGSTTTVSTTLNNTNPNGGATVAVNLANNGGTGGTVTGLTSSSGTTVAAGASSTVTGTFTAGTVGTGETYSIKNTDANASPSTIATGGTANVYNHGTGTLSVTSPTTIKAITGTTVTSTLVLQNVGANNDNITNITGGTGVTGLPGTLTANQTGTATGTKVAGASGTTTTATYTATYAEDQTVIGATAGTQTATAPTVTITNFDHANGVLTITSPTTVKAIAGATVNSTGTFANSGANNDNLTAGTAGGGLTGATGTFVANQSTTVNGSFTAGAAGTTATHNYTQGYTEDQTVIGATTGTQTATAGVTVTSYNHATGTLTITSPTTVKAIAGTTINSTATFANAGANNDNLIAGTAGGGLTAATGTFTANQATPLNGSFVAGAAGTTATNNFTQNYTEDQTVIGATAGTQTATAGVTVQSFTHANGVLTITSPTTVKAIAGTAVHSTATFANSGATNDNLTAGTAGGGLTAATGTFIANQSTTLNGTFTAGAAGTTATNTFTQNFTEDQTVLGATAGTQTAAAGVQVQSFNHAVGTLAITTPTTVKAITGTTVNSTLTFTNNGANNDNLSIVSTGAGVTGLSGTFTGNQSVTTVSGAKTAGAAGTTTTATYSATYLEDQTVLGATAGNQTVNSGTVTITNFNHALGVLAVTSPTAIRAISGATINSTLTFTNSGTNNDNLTAGTAGGGLTAAAGTFTANQSSALSGTFVAGAIGSTTTNTFTQNYTEDQTVLGATAGTQTASAGVTVTALGHSAPSLSTATDNIGFVHIGGTVANATTTLSNGAGTLAGLQIVSLGGLTDSGTGLIAAGAGRSLSAAVNTSTAGAVNTVYTIQTEDDQTVVGATANANKTFTVSGNVYSGQGVWNTNGGGSWGTINNPVNWTALGGAPGLDTHFTTTDTATFGSVTNAGTAVVTLDGDNPSLRAITFDDPVGGNYNLTQGTGGTIHMNAGAGNTATITNTHGGDQISAPVELDSNTAVSVSSAGDTLNLSGNISGAAANSLTLGAGGPGKIILGGANTFTGATTITSGTVQFASDNALTSSSSVTVTGGTLDVDGHNETLKNFSSTGGTLTNTGGGAPTTITFDLDEDPVNASNITGNVAINKTGVGLLALTGNNTYTGGTTITSGTLQAGSATAFGTGDVNNVGGTLGAYGAQHVINVGHNYTQSAGGTLLLNLNTDALTSANNDILNVTGTASLNGPLDIHFGFLPVKNDAFKVVTTGGGIIQLGAGFSSPTVISQAGILVTGNLTNAGNDLTLTVTQAQLQLAPVLGSFATPNRTAILTALSSPTLATTDPTLFNILATLVTSQSAAQLPASLADTADQFNPAKFGNFVQSTIVNNAVFNTAGLDSYWESQRSAHGDFLTSNAKLDSSGLTVVNPSMDPALAQVGSRLLAWSPAGIGHGMLSDSATPVIGGVDMKATQSTNESISNDRFSAFVVGNVILAQNFSQTDVAHSDTTTGGMQLGADYRLTPHLRAGALFGYNHTDGTLDNLRSKATIDTYAPGAYVSYADSGWYANGTASYGFNNYTEDRHLSLLGGTAVAHGAPSGSQITANIDGGYDFHANKLTYGPLAGLQYTHLSVDSYNEDGAGALGANLAVGNQSGDSLRSRLGGHVSYLFQTGKVLLTPHLDASWQHEFMDQAEGITAGIGGVPFTVTTSRPSRDSVLLDGGLNADLNGTVSVFGDYLIQAGQSNYFGQSVQAGIKIGF